jgi:hypothetical protein
MTPEHVKARVEEIERESMNSEGAHCMEDTLYQDVLIAIGEGAATDPAACAREALKTREIKFARWYS